MDGRGMLLIAGLAAAVAVPYVMTTKDRTDKTSQGFWDAMWSETTDDEQSLGMDPGAVAVADAGWAAPQIDAGQGASAMSPYPMVPPWGPGTSHASAMGVVPGGYPAAYGATAYSPSAARAPQSQAPYYRDPAQSLAELLRFDLTPPWVMNRWSRVSTQIRSGDWSGLRVTMISGLSMYDLAGSLTYYFDDQQHLQRIEMEGTTGDPRQLVTFVTRHYGLEAEPACGGQLYVRKDRQIVSSGLLVQLAPVVRSTEPHQRYRVRLELSRPGSNAPISDGFQELLESDASRSSEK